jgi:hypothetical protein
VSRRQSAKTEESPGFTAGPWPWIVAILGTFVFVFRDILFRGSISLFRDHLMVYLPREAAYRAALAEGAIPLWDPLFLGGQPFAANPGRQVFYPPHLISLVGSLGTGYNLFLLFHLVVAALGMFVLLRFAGTRHSTATLGAMTFALSGYGLSLYHLLPILTTVCWMPWIARFTEGFLRTRRPLEFLGATLSLGLLALSGDPVQAGMTGLLMVGWSAARQDWSNRVEAMRAVPGDAGRVLAIGITSLVLASAQIVTGFDFVRDTARSEGLSFELVSLWSFPPERLLEMVFPSVFDQIAPGRLYPEAEGAGLMVSVHLGIVACVLILAGVAARLRGAGWLMAAVILSGIAAAGSHTPLLRFAYDLGLFRNLRYPVKFLIPVIGLMVFWGALVLERLRAGDDRLRRMVLGFSIAVVVVSGAFLATAQQPEGNAYWLKVTAIAVAAAVLLMVVARAKGEIAAVLLVAFVVVVDLDALSRKWVPAVPGGLLEVPRATEGLDPDKESYRILNDAALRLMDYADPEGRAWFKAIDVLLHRGGMFPMANGIWGYSSVLEWDTEHTALLPTKQFQSAMYAVRESGQSRWMSMFTSMANARYTTTFRPIATAQLSGASDALAIRPVDFVRVGDSPRYDFATSLRRAASVEHFIGDLQNGNWEPGATWVDFDPFQPASGTVLSVEESRHRIALKVRAEGRSYLNIAITPHRYWSATIDGAAATLHVTNVGFQGLEVPAGEHTIELRYHNPVVMPALFASILALVVLVAGTVALELKRRN